MVTGKGFRVPDEGTIGQGSQLFRAQQVSSKTSPCIESRVVKIKNKSSKGNSF